MKLEDEIKIFDPEELTDEGLEYLELGTIPTDIDNPFNKYALDEIDPADELIELLNNQDYLHFAVRHLLNIELLPYQLVVLDMLWRKRLPMLIGCRGMGKSFILAVYALLRMVFHPGCKIVICGASFRQSRQVFEYMTEVWNKAPILQDVAGRGKEIGPRREIDRCQFTIGTSKCFAIPIGSGEKIRGMRANYILSDEHASIQEEIFNLVIQGFGVVASEPVQKVKEFAVIKRLKKLGQWTDEMERLHKMQNFGNQIVFSGTANYAFNHFYKSFCKWHQIIRSKGDMNKLKEIFTEGDALNKGFNWLDYAIARVPYDKVPEGVLEPAIVAQAKATLNHNQFLIEYGCIFATDSGDFYKRSAIEAATTNKPILLSTGEYVQFSAKRYGDKKKAHVLAIDPAADLDNAAIVILELNQEHRKVVYCWTTNRKRYNILKKEMLKQGVELQDDYYRYIAKKVRQLMRDFNIEHIIMDKHGGGSAIEEALGSKDTCNSKETPIYPIPNIEEPKLTDGKEGLHILELLAPTQEFNAESNHGMLKDIQEKVLLFPLFDNIEIERGLELDKINNITYDTYEDLVEEIEELKTEMTTIVVTPSSVLGKETFDTPNIKSGMSRKGRLRKDRYSALLYANYYARTKDKTKPSMILYQPVGGTKDTIKHTVQKQGPMYYGPGMAKFGDFSKSYKPNFGFTKR